MGVLLIFILCIAGSDLLILLSITSQAGLMFLVMTQLLSLFAGLWILRRQDIKVIFYIETLLNKGERVVFELWSEALYATAALMLCLPGYLTDFFAILFLFPKVRDGFIRFVFKHY